MMWSYQILHALLRNTTGKCANTNQESTKNNYLLGASADAPLRSAADRIAENLAMVVK